MQQTMRYTSNTVAPISTLGTHLKASHRKCFFSFLYHDFFVLSICLPLTEPLFFATCSPPFIRIGGFDVSFKHFSSGIKKHAHLNNEVMSLYIESFNIEHMYSSSKPKKFAFSPHTSVGQLPFFSLLSLEFLPATFSSNQ